MIAATVRRLAILLVLATGFSPAVRADDSKILGFMGPTMGTRYMVKVYDPPEFEKDVRLQIDALLRQVNDQMSTYLESSELSRFNDSESTDWFEVSSDTATVVRFAQSVAEKTDGAFDVTVGPLVNAWSFGPDPRTQSIPEASRLDQLKSWTGYARLST